MNADEFWLAQSLMKQEPPKQKRKKPPKYKLPEWVVKRYEDAHLEYNKINYPHGFKDGHYLKPILPDYQTDTGLEKFICNYCLWVGGIATGIQSMGRQLPNGKWIKGRVLKGTSDMKITHHLNGFEFSFEIKIGKDRPSDEQLEVQRRTRKTGGVYEFGSTPMDFFEVYDKVGQIIISKPLGLFD